MRLTAFSPHGRIVLGIAVLLLTAPAWAYDEQNDRATLKGIKAIRVGVEDISPDAEKDGLTQSQLQTDVELRLRKAGITVSPTATEYLYVTVAAIKQRQNLWYTFNIRVELSQFVVLLRDPQISSFATTWGVGYYGTKSPAKLTDLRNNVADLVDQFINAYLEQNPKR